MFFKFCSDQNYGQEYWCIIWDIETAIQALILTDTNAIRTSSDEEFKNNIFNLLKLFSESLGVVRKQYNSEWVSYYLDQEMPNIRGFMDTLPDDKIIAQSNQILKDMLMPTSRFHLCLKNSVEFRAYCASKSRRDLAVGSNNSSDVK